MEKTEGVFWHNAQKLNVIQIMNKVITLALLASEASYFISVKTDGFNIEEITFDKKKGESRDVTVKPL